MDGSHGDDTCDTVNSLPQKQENRCYLCRVIPHSKDVCSSRPPRIPPSDPCECCGHSYASYWDSLSDFCDDHWSDTSDLNLTYYESDMEDDGGDDHVDKNEEAAGCSLQSDDCVDIKRSAMFFGEVEGVRAGKSWCRYYSCMASGVHEDTSRELVFSGDGVVSAMFINTIIDFDGGVELVFSSPLVTPEDLHHALKQNMQHNRPVRVIRTHKMNSRFAPDRGCRYDGLYHVTYLANLVQEDGVRLFAKLVLSCDQPAPPEGRHSQRKVFPDKDSSFLCKIEESEIEALTRAVPGSSSLQSLKSWSSGDGNMNGHTEVTDELSKSIAERVKRRRESVIFSPRPRRTVSRNSSKKSYSKKATKNSKSHENRLLYKHIFGVRKRRSRKRSRKGRRVICKIRNESFNISSDLPVDFVRCDVSPHSQIRADVFAAGKFFANDLTSANSGCQVGETKTSYESKRMTITSNTFNINGMDLICAWREEFDDLLLAPPAKSDVAQLEKVLSGRGSRLPELEFHNKKHTPTAGTGSLVVRYVLRECRVELQRLEL